VSDKKIHFPGLNGLRFIAALVVILHHVEFIKPRLGLSINTHFFLPGHYGVILFFVLSGFLITYLLFKEYESSGGIDLKKFYIRRILRIWPLYFLAVGAAFTYQFVRGEIETMTLIKSLLLYIFFLPNVANVFYPLIEYIYHLWTIGVEELFYLIWPVLLLLFYSRMVYMSALTVAVFGFGKPVLLYIVSNFFPGHNDVLAIFLNLEFECMAIGAIGAYILYFRKERLLKIIYNRWVAGISLALVLVFFQFHYYLYINSVIYSLLFIILILNISTNPLFVLKLENPVLTYLGKISYGIYIFHIFVIGMTMAVLMKFIDIKNEWFDMVLAHGISALMTIGVASLSYEYVEKPFLSLKERFSVLKQ
jgi:peptidoglycan/LPS O-acetylase OafA/YrhL